jgi:hypothetical protein
MKYRVTVYEESWVDHFVEADSEEEAESKVRNCESDSYKTTQCDYDIIEIEEVGA